MQYISQLTRTDILIYQEQCNRIVRNISMSNGKKWVPFFERDENYNLEGIKVDFIDKSNGKIGTFIYTDFEVTTAERKPYPPEQIVYQTYMKKLFKTKEVATVKTMKYADLETSEIREISYVNGSKRPYVIETAAAPKEKTGDYKADCAKFFAERQGITFHDSKPKITKQTILSC